MFFIGLLVFILNSSHKYIKNYQEELKNQHLRNLEEIEVDWHKELFNQKTSINYSAQDKNTKVLQYEKIRFFEEKEKENLNENNNNFVDKEIELIIDNSFFANGTLMLRNSSKAPYNSSEKDANEHLYFLGNKIKRTGSNSNYNTEDININNNNRTYNISSYYFDYINKFRKIKIRNSNFSYVDSTSKNKKNKKNDKKRKYKNKKIVENEDYNNRFYTKKLNDSEIKIDHYATNGENSTLTYLEFDSNLSNIYNIYNNNVFSDEEIIQPSGDERVQKPKPLTHRSMLGRILTL